MKYIWCYQKGFFFDDLVQMGCVFHCVDFHSRGTNPIHDLKLLKKYKSLIREIKPIAVLTYTIKPNVYGGMACTALGIPYISNITGLGDAIEKNGLLSTIARKLYRRGLKKANMVFFQNQTNYAYFINNKGDVE